MRQLACVAALAVLSACAANFNVETAATYTVGYSEGGDIETWERRVRRLNAEGKRAVIPDGAHCISACTFLVAVRNVCVGPNAILGFHAATAYENDPHGDDYWTARAAAHYPPKLRAWFYSNATHLQTFTRDLKGWQVSRLADIPLCEAS